MEGKSPHGEELAPGVPGGRKEGGRERRGEDNHTSIKQKQSFGEHNYNKHIPLASTCTFNQPKGLKQLWQWGQNF